MSGPRTGTALRRRSAPARRTRFVDLHLRRRRLPCSRQNPFLTPDLAVEKSNRISLGRTEVLGRDDNNKGSSRRWPEGQHYPNTKASITRTFRIVLCFHRIPTHVISIGGVVLRYSCRRFPAEWNVIITPTIVSLSVFGMRKHEPADGPVRSRLAWAQVLHPSLFISRTEAKGAVQNSRV